MPASHPVTTTGRFLALSLLLVVVVACGDKPPPSRAPAPPASPARRLPVRCARRPGSSGGPAASLGPGPGPVTGSGDASGDRITAAYEAGTIDRASALLYRLQASIGDERLPAEYRGNAIEDDGAALIVLEEWDTFTDAQREAFLPYVVRPTDPRSVFALPKTATIGRPVAAAVTLASTHAAVTAATCVDGFARQDVPGIPVIVWGQCGSLSEGSVLGLVDEIAADVADAWDPLVTLMGDPIGDANDPADDFPDAPEGNDGLLDIYVVAGSVGGRERAISTDALAATSPTGPWGGPANALTTSAYMVVDWTAGAGVALQSTIVHELFHAFQYAHNNSGLMVAGSNGSMDAPLVHGGIGDVVGARVRAGGPCE